MSETNYYFNPDNIIKQLILIVGILGLSKALLEYTKAQRWEKGRVSGKISKRVLC
jgi:hypothetical protein